MAPDEMRKFLDNVDRGRRDFLRNLIAGAAFAPPLIASFSLAGPSIASAQVTSNQCVANQTAGSTISFNFSGTQYQDNFQGLLRASDITPGLDLGGTGHTALNFKGTANTAGSTWLTVVTEDPFPTPTCEWTLEVDVLITKFNNAKGLGPVALYNETTKQGLALLLFDVGNSDALQLVTFDQTGKPTVLKTQSLGAGIAENVWYHVVLDITDPTFNPVEITGAVFRHTVPTDPNSPLGTQVGGNLEFSGPLPAGLDPNGLVGLAARAVSAAVDSSATNFTATGFPAV